VDGRLSGHDGRRRRAKKALTREQQEKISNLRDEVLALREADVDRREELLKLREESRGLKEQLSLSDALKFESPYYWLNNNGQKEGPYCQVCRDRDQKLVRLIPRRVPGAWDCKVCKTFFTDRNYSAPGNTVVRSDYSPFD
jgi:hypothetical protein